jgi:predicted PurR-regulated permease PerM
MQPLDRKLSAPIFLGTLVLANVILYWGRPVLMPVALSILLTFLLNPVVNAVHRRGLNRVPAVILVVLFVCIGMGGVIYSVGGQITSLLAELPEYKDNIRKKISDFRTAGRGSAVEKFQSTLKELMGEIEKEEPVPAPVESPGEQAAEPSERPVPVVVQSDRSTRRILPAALGPVVEMLATFGLVVVLVIFMLLRLQELRNRLFRLVGHSRLSTTTKALDEAAARISRYLLMQTIINATYGFAVGVGLFFIGLPYAALWGFLAFLVRFIPYVGPWLGALLPTALSLAVFDGWMQPLLVVAVIVALELISNMVMEPWLYGQSVGVSEVALLVAIAFWTWIWGPVGLALATPLTVCLVVLCKYIPELEFVEMLMGDEPVLDPPLIYYQRLLAMDQDEAAELVHAQLKAQPTEQVLDELFIPALKSAKLDFSRNKLTEADRDFVVTATRELVESIDFRGASGPSIVSGIRAQESDSSNGGIRVFGVPAHDCVDEVALLTFRRLLEVSRCRMEVASSAMLSSEMLSTVLEKRPALIVIGSLPPDPLAPTRYLCKRLREHFPEIKILVGRWGYRGPAHSGQHLLQSLGADHIGFSLAESRSQVLQIAQILSSPPSNDATAAQSPASAPTSAVASIQGISAIETV